MFDSSPYFILCSALLHGQNNFVHGQNIFVRDKIFRSPVKSSFLLVRIQFMSCPKFFVPDKTFLSRPKIFFPWTKHFCPWTKLFCPCRWMRHKSIFWPSRLSVWRLSVWLVSITIFLHPINKPNHYFHWHVHLSCVCLYVCFPSQLIFLSNQ